MSRRRRASAVTLLAALLLGGCQTYVIEYHERPDFHRMASSSPLPEEGVAEDGRLIRFSAPPRESGTAADGPERERIEVWTEAEDGSVRLYCISPQHVLTAMMECIRRERYEVLFEQLLAPAARDAWLQSGRTADDFAAWVHRNRREMMATLNRMSFGAAGSDAVIERIERGVIRCRLTPRAMAQFRFREVIMVSDPPGLKLFSIR